MKSTRATDLLRGYVGGDDHEGEEEINDKNGTRHTNQTPHQSQKTPSRRPLRVDPSALNTPSDTVPATPNQHHPSTPITPFSPLFRNNPTLRESALLDVSLTMCRRVSVMVMVEEETANTTSKSKRCLYPATGAAAGRDLLVVHPSALPLPRDTVFDTAQRIGSSNTEDWVRSYRFHQVVWGDHATTTSLTTLAQAVGNDLWGEQPKRLQQQFVNSNAMENGEDASLERLFVGLSHGTTKTGETLFGTAANRSVAQTMAIPRDLVAPADILHHYGVMGLIMHSFQTDNPLCTLSILEVVGEDHVYDLLVSKPYHSSRTIVQLSHGGRVVVGLSRVRIDSLRQLGHVLRRAFTAANHPHRRTPRGHIVATLTVAPNHSFRCVHVTTDQTSENASSLTALGRILRSALLRQAGTYRPMAFRDSLLTQVLQPSFSTPHARVVVLSHVESTAGPGTQATLRYLHQLVARPGPLVAESPFAHDDDTNEQTTFWLSPEARHDPRWIEALVADPRQRLAQALEPSGRQKRRKAAFQTTQPRARSSNPTQYADPEVWGDEEVGTLQRTGSDRFLGPEDDNSVALVDDKQGRFADAQGSEEDERMPVRRKGRTGHLLNENTELGTESFDREPSNVHGTIQQYADRQMLEVEDNSQPPISNEYHDERIGEQDHMFHSAAVPNGSYTSHRANPTVMVRDEEEVTPRMSGSSRHQRGACDDEDNRSVPTPTSLNGAAPSDLDDFLVDHSDLGAGWLPPAWNEEEDPKLQDIEHANHFDDDKNESGNKNNFNARTVPKHRNNTDANMVQEQQAKPKSVSFADPVMGSNPQMPQQQDWSESADSLLVSEHVAIWGPTTEESANDSVPRSSGELNSESSFTGEISSQSTRTFSMPEVDSDGKVLRSMQEDSACATPNEPAESTMDSDAVSSQTQDHSGSTTQHGYAHLDDDVHGAFGNSEIAPTIPPWKTKVSQTDAPGSRLPDETALGNDTLGIDTTAGQQTVHTRLQLDEDTKPESLDQATTRRAMDSPKNGAESLISTIRRVGSVSYSDPGDTGFSFDVQKVSHHSTQGRFNACIDAPHIASSDSPESAVHEIFRTIPSTDHYAPSQDTEMQKLEDSKQDEVLSGFSRYPGSNAPNGNEPTLHRGSLPNNWVSVTNNVTRRLDSNNSSDDKNNNVPASTDANRVADDRFDWDAPPYASAPVNEQTTLAGSETTYGTESETASEVLLTACPSQLDRYDGGIKEIAFLEESPASKMLSTARTSQANAPQLGRYDADIEDSAFLQQYPGSNGDPLGRDLLTRDSRSSVDVSNPGTDLLKANTESQDRMGREHHQCAFSPPDDSGRSKQRDRHNSEGLFPEAHEVELQVDKAARSLENLGSNGSKFPANTLVKSVGRIVENWAEMAHSVDATSGSSDNEKESVTAPSSSESKATLTNGHLATSSTDKFRRETPAGGIFRQANSSVISEDVPDQLVRNGSNVEPSHHHGDAVGTTVDYRLTNHDLPDRLLERSTIIPPTKAPSDSNVSRSAGHHKTLNSYQKNEDHRGSVLSSLLGGAASSEGPSPTTERNSSHSLNGDQGGNASHEEAVDAGISVDSTFRSPNENVPLTTCYHYESDSPGGCAKPEMTADHEYDWKRSSRTDHSSSLLPVDQARMQSPASSLPRIEGGPLLGDDASAGTVARAKDDLRLSQDDESESSPCKTKWAALGNVLYQNSHEHNWNIAEELVPSQGDKDGAAANEQHIRGVNKPAETVPSECGEKRIQLDDSVSGSKPQHYLVHSAVHERNQDVENGFNAIGIDNVSSDSKRQHDFKQTSGDEQYQRGLISAAEGLPMEGGEVDYVNPGTIDETLRHEDFLPSWRSDSSLNKTSADDPTQNHRKCENIPVDGVARIYDVLVESQQRSELDDTPQCEVSQCSEECATPGVVERADSGNPGTLVDDDFFPDRTRRTWNPHEQDRTQQYEIDPDAGTIRALRLDEVHCDRKNQLGLLETAPSTRLEDDSGNHDSIEKAISDSEVRRNSKQIAQGLLFNEGDASNLGTIPTERENHVVLDSEQKQGSSNTLQLNRKPLDKYQIDLSIPETAETEPAFCHLGVEAQANQDSQHRFQTACLPTLEKAIESATTDDLVDDGPSKRELTKNDFTRNVEETQDGQDVSVLSSRGSISDRYQPTHQAEILENILQETEVSVGSTTERRSIDSLLREIDSDSGTHLLRDRLGALHRSLGSDTDFRQNPNFDTTLATDAERARTIVSSQDSRQELDRGNGILPVRPLSSRNSDIRAIPPLEHPGADGAPWAVRRSSHLNERSSSAQQYENSQVGSEDVIKSGSSIPLSDMDTSSLHIAKIGDDSVSRGQEEVPRKDRYIGFSPGDGGVSERQFPSTKNNSKRPVALAQIIPTPQEHDSMRVIEGSEVRSVARGAGQQHSADANEPTTYEMPTDRFLSNVEDETNYNSVTQELESLVGTSELPEQRAPNANVGDFTDSQTQTNDIATLPLADSGGKATISRPFWQKRLLNSKLEAEQLSGYGNTSSVDIQEDHSQTDLTKAQGVPEDGTGIRSRTNGEEKAIQIAEETNVHLAGTAVYGDAQNARDYVEEDEQDHKNHPRQKRKEALFHPKGPATENEGPFRELRDEKAGTNLAEDKMEDTHRAEDSPIHRLNILKSATISATGDSRRNGLRSETEFTVGYRTRQEHVRSVDDGIPNNSSRRLSTEDALRRLRSFETENTDRHPSEVTITNLPTSAGSPARSHRSATQNSAITEDSGLLEIDELEAAVDKVRQTNITVWQDSLLSIDNIRRLQAAQLEELTRLRNERNQARSEVERLRKELRLLSESHHDLIEKNAREAQIMNEEISSCKSVKEELVKIAEDAIGMQAELERKVDDLEKEIRKLHSTRVPKEDYDSLDVVASSLRAKIEHLAGEVHGRNEELEKSEKNLEEAKKSLRGQEEALNRLEAVRSESQTEIASMRVELEELRCARSELEATQANLEKHQRDSEQLLLHEREQNLHLKSQLSVSRREVSTIPGLQSEIADLRTELDEARSLLAASNATSSMLECDKSSIQERLDSTSAELDRRISDVNELTSCTKKLLEERETDRSKIATMERALASFQQETKTRVEKVVRHRNEAARLLETALNENRDLEETNQKLSKSFEQLQAEHNSAMTSLQVLSQKTQTSMPDLHSNTRSRENHDSFENASRSSTPLRPAVDSAAASRVPSLLRSNWGSDTLNRSKETSASYEGESRETSLSRTEELAATLALATRSRLDGRHYGDQYGYSDFDERLYKLEDEKDQEIVALRNRIKALERRTTARHRVAQARR